MFGLGPATRIYLAAGATDMRKGFEGLYELARDRLRCEPLSGELFVFANAQRNRLKVLYWGVSRTQGNLRSCTEDGRRPPGAGFQELAPNRPELLRSKGVVVNVRGKGIR